MKVLLRCIGLLLVGVFLSIVFVGWSETGLKLLVSVAENRFNGTFRAGLVRGTLLSGWQIDDVQLHLDGSEVRMATLSAGYSAGELFARRLHVLEFASSGVEIILSESEEPESDIFAASQIQLPVVTSPLALLVDRIHVENLSLQTGEASELMRIYRLESGLSLNSTILTLNNFQVDADGFALRLNGTLDMGESWKIDLNGSAEYSQFGVGPVAGSVSFAGPLNAIGVRLDLNKPAQGYIEGVIGELPNGFVWEADLDINGAQLADFHETMPVLELEVQGKAYGRMAEYGGHLTGSIDYLFLQGLGVELELDGDQNQIDFHEINADADYGRGRLTDGMLSWENGLKWSGNLVLTDIQTEYFIKERTGMVSGSLVSSGSFDEAGLEIEANVTDVVVQLPHRKILGKGGVHVRDNTIVVSDVRLESDTVYVGINGSAAMALGFDSWQEALQWNVKVQVEDFDPALLHPQYPGTLDAVLSSKGSLTGKTREGVIDIGSLSGMVRGYPVHGKGNIQIQDMEYMVENLLLQSGETSLVANGRAGESLEIDLSFQSPDLGELLHGGAGKIEISSKVTGEVTKPEVIAEVEADGIVFRDYGIEHLVVDISGGLEEESEFSVSLDGKGVKVESLRVDSGTFSLQGNQKEHAFRAKVSGHDGSVDVKGSGGFEDEMEWSGKITAMQFTHPYIGELTLKDGVAVTASTKDFSVTDFCLQESESELCTSAKVDLKERVWDAQLGWQDIQLARIMRFVDLVAPITGTSNAHVSAGGTGAELTAVSGRVEIQDAAFGDQQEMPQYQSLRLEKGGVDITLEDEKLRTSFNFDFADGSMLALTAGMNGFGRLSRESLNLPLTGKLQANVENLEFIGPVTNYLVQPSGSLQGQLDLAGTLFRPEMVGDLALIAGTIEMPAWGISMTGVEFTVQAVERRLALAGKAGSGPGWLEASGELELGGDGIGGMFRITGENFDTLMVPEYQIRTSPDLRMAFTTRGAELTGTLKVPHAVLMPKEMTGSVTESEDVIYTDNVEATAERGTNFSTALQVELGDDVYLDAYGLTGYLRGELKILKTPDTLLTGKGELSLVDGVFSVYGKTLDIVRSRVLFLGGPLDNPGLDVRAEKVVADKEIRGEPIRVGVDVGGTVEDLEFTLFSNPPMEESDILSYMVVGRSMSETGEGDESSLRSAALLFGLDKSMKYIQGVTSILPVDEMYIDGGGEEDVSLVVGKQVTDELYIGYDHNFFEQQGEIRLRYDLTKGFSVETRSSAKSTGADLWFSLEN